MKKVLSLLLFSALIPLGMAQENDPVLMNIGGKDITKSEFVYIWSKNNTNTTPDRKSLDEYVHLFVNFKLKVAEAEAQGVDTTEAFVTELNGYRRQLIAPYLTDKAAEEALINTCYDRFRTYNEVSHILIRVDEQATPEDTMAAWNKVQKLYKQLLKGEDFAKMAKENSEDNSKEEGGYLGYSTGLRYVYPFENAVYETPVGQISAPIRSQFGYHIVKVHKRFPAGGRFRSGHIMKMVSPEASAQEKAAAKDSIFKIYDALVKGGDFTKFATEQSDDQGAAQRGGEYGLLFCGNLPYEYDEQVYRLKVGEFSKPFQSKFGWHIVKALEFQPYPSIDEMKNDFTGFISQGDRSKVVRESLVEKLKKAYGYTLNIANFQAFVKGYENARLKNDSTMLSALAESNAPLFVLDRKPFSQGQFAAAIKRSNYNRNNLNASLNQFVQEKVMAYEDSRLEKKYPEFGHLMQEYRDGILLFDVSNREVWEKASTDTEGLKNYFDQNKAKYNWEKPHYKGFVIQCANKNVAKKAAKLIKKLPDDSVAVALKRNFNTDTTILVKVDRGLFVQGENPQVDYLAFKQKQPEPSKNFPVVFLRGRTLPVGPEDYSDVKGLVISDYQNYLEEEWIKYLRGKYKVTINQNVLNTVN